MRKGIALAVASASMAAGCVCPQDDCMYPAVTICVTDADTNQPIEDAVVELVSGSSYHEITGGSNCRTLYDDPINEARLRVSAPGYSEAEFDVSVSHDFCGHPVGQRRDVELTKTGGSPKVLVGPESEGCG